MPVTHSRRDIIINQLGLCVLVLKCGSTEKQCIIRLSRAETMCKRRNHPQDMSYTLGQELLGIRIQSLLSS
jgi:hypothetical protein